MKFLSKVIMLALGVALCGTSLAQTAASEVRLDIAAQPISDALNEFARQAGLQVFFMDSGSSLQVRSTALAGTYKPQEALARLLSNTGLKYEYIDARTVAIRSARSDDGESSGMRSADGRVRLTRVSADADAKTEASSKSKKEDEEKPTMIVEGERDKPYQSTNVDLPRTVDDAKAYYIYDAEQLQNSGATSVEDFLVKRLPMLTNEQTYSNIAPGSVSSHVRATSQLDLRTLGTDQTVVLVNGRRVPGIVSAFSSSQAQPDLNGIPVSAIERIEVLPSSSSGIYGGGAVGGVINVILKQNYAGVETNLQYENTFDSDAAMRRAEVTAGLGLEGGRTQVLLTGTFSDANELQLRDRLDMISAARQRIWANAPEFQYDMPPLGATPNIYTYSPALTLKSDGTSLNSQYTHLPLGYRGVDMDGTAALLANAGTVDIGYAETAQPDNGLNASLGATPRRKGVVANIRREMTDKLEVFIDFSYAENYTTDTTGRTFSVSVPASAPSNPFNERVTVAFPDAVTTRTGFNRNVQRRLAGGFKYELPRNWLVQLDHAMSDSTAKWDNFYNDPVQIRTAIEDGSLNPFVDTIMYPLALKQYWALAEGQTQVDLETTTLRGSGPIFTLPAGDVRLTASVERLETSFPDTRYATWFPNRPDGNETRVTISQGQESISTYLETLIPFFSSKNARAGLQELDLQLALRREDFTVDTLRTASGSGSYTLTVANPNPPELFPGTAEYTSSDQTIGIRYKPIEDIMVRLAWSKAFNPPRYNVLTPPQRSTRTINVMDPQRGDELTPVYYLWGGNPMLEPENAKNWTAGLVLTPRFLKGLRVALDYSRIEKSDNWGYRQAQEIVNLEDIYPSRVVRGEAAPGDPYGVGLIETVETSILNLYTAKYESLDLSVSHHLETSSHGTFTFSGLATKLMTSEVQQSLTEDPLNAIGFSGSIRYRGNLNLNWNRDRWAAGWSMTYYGDYAIQRTPYSWTDYWLEVQGSDSVPSQSYHDAFMSYTIPADAGLQGWKTWLSGTQYRLGIKNVFDSEPEFDAAFAHYGSYVGPFGGLRLRSYWLSLKKSF